jgi:hypothetical protein
MSSFMKDHFEMYVEEEGQKYVYFSDGMVIEKSFNEKGNPVYGMVKEDSLTPKLTPEQREKRYKDMKKYYDKKIKKHNERIKIPRTIEELEQFKAQYPDVYDVIKKEEQDGTN